jgi:hypothetical protein
VGGCWTVKGCSDTLHLIRHAFPGRDDLIEQAYRRNRPFKELCDDYRRCVLALERWKQEENNQTGRRISEYAELLGQLAAEIGTWVQAMETCSYGPRGGSP